MISSLWQIDWELARQRSRNKICPQKRKRIYEVIAGRKFGQRKGCYIASRRLVAGQIILTSHPLDYIAFNTSQCLDPSHRSLSFLKSPQQSFGVRYSVCDVSNEINRRSHHMYWSDVLYLRLDLLSASELNTFGVQNPPWPWGGRHPKIANSFLTAKSCLRFLFSSIEVDIDYNLQIVDVRVQISCSFCY